MADGKPFKLSIISDVSDVIRGNRDIEGSFDEVADALDDVARESADAGRDLAKGMSDGASDAGREIEKQLDDAAREGEQSAEKLERSFRDAFDEVKGSARTSTRDVATDTRDNFREAGEGVETFRDEAKANLSEALSSFRGEVEEIPDLIQGVFGGVTADLGVGGMIGAGLVAAGAGLAIKFYEDWKEQSERVEQRISDMYDDMLESGQNYLSDQFLNEQISGILNGAEDAVIDYARAQEIAGATGLDLATVVRGYAGEAESAQAVQAALNEKIREADEEFRAAASDGNAFGQALFNDGPKLEDYRDQLGQVNENIATARDRAEVFRGAHITSAEAVRDHMTAVAEFDDTLRDARETIATNNEEIEDGTERARENRGVLSDLAGSMLELRDSAREAGASTSDLTALQLEQAGQFLDTAKAAGIEESAALDLAEQLGLIPSSVATEIREHGAQAVIDRANEVKAVAEAVTRNPYRMRVEADLPTQAELQERLNALVWGLTAPAAQVQVRYGQSIQ